MRRSEPLCRCKPESPLEALGIAGPYLGVDDARPPRAVKRVETLLAGYPAHVRPRFPGHSRRMRARKHIIELQQRMIRRWRFFGPDIQASPGDQFVAQRPDQPA